MDGQGTRRFADELKIAWLDGNPLIRFLQLHGKAIMLLRHHDASFTVQFLFLEAMQAHATANFHGI